MGIWAIVAGVLPLAVAKMVAPLIVPIPIALLPDVEHRSSKYLNNGLSSLTDRVPRPLRLATAWPQLACAI